MSPTLRQLVDHEREIHSEETVGYRLTSRNGLFNKTEPFQVLGNDKSMPVLEAWHKFHSGIPYDNFREFYSKSTFCLSQTFQQLDKEKFLYLIADRTFLFLEYNEHRNNPDCPPLSRLCLSPSFYSTKTDKMRTEFLICMGNANDYQLSFLANSPDAARKILTGAVEHLLNDPESPITLINFTNCIWNMMEWTEESPPSKSVISNMLQQIFSRFFAYSKVARNAELVLCQAFIPTYGHLHDFNKMRENYSILSDAIERRKLYLSRYRGSAKGKTYDNFVSFSIPVSSSETADVTDIERRLSVLFHAYLKATFEHAYQYDYKPYIEAGETSWVNEIHCVYQYLQGEGISGVDHALVFYHLFSSQTKKLAGHKLKKYTFSLPTNTCKAKEPPERVRPQISQRNFCNIMLFDYLLWLLPSEDLEYSRFQFYAFTNYEWYTHFEIPNVTQDTFEPKFDLTPDLSRGVDELGHLLRRNISFCIPNGFEWLNPGLPNTKAEDAGVLVTLLLQDASIKASAFRLTNKIHQSLEKNGSTLLEQFLNLQLDKDGLTTLINNYCNKNGLFFRGENELYEREPFQSEKHLLYSRYILEFELRNLLYEKACVELRRMAQKYFGDLLISDDPFLLNEIR